MINTVDVFPLSKKVHNNGEYLKKIIIKACSYETAQDAVEPVIESLKDYTHCNNLHEAVENVAKEHFLSSTNICVQPVMGGGTKGVSGSPIFRVCISSTKDKSQAFVKAFVKYLEFVEELRAITTVKKLNLEKSHHVKILMVGKYQDNNKRYALMVQTPAKGQGIDDHIVNFLNNRVDERAFKSMLKVTNNAFCELHTRTRSSDSAKLNEFIDSIHDMIEKFDIFYKAEGKKSFIKKVNNLINSAKKSSASGTIIHGDSHPGNIFAQFNHEKYKITWIDIHSLDKSTISKTTTGNAPPERDLSNFVVRVYEKCVRLVSDNYDYETIRAFVRGNNIQVTPQEDLLTIRSLMGYICKCEKILEEISQSNEFYIKELEIRQKSMILLNQILKKYTI